MPPEQRKKERVDASLSIVRQVFWTADPESIQLSFLETQRLRAMGTFQFLGNVHFGHLVEHIRFARTEVRTAV